MDRLIYKEADGDLTCRARDFERVFPMLYAYEETGLTPEEIIGLKANLEAMTELARDLSEKLAQVQYPTTEDVLEAVMKGTSLQMTDEELAMQLVCCFGGVPAAARKLVHEAARRLLLMEDEQP